MTSTDLTSPFSTSAFYERQFPALSFETALEGTDRVLSELFKGSSHTTAQTNAEKSLLKENFDLNKNVEIRLSTLDSYAKNTDGNLQKLGIKTAVIEIAQGNKKTYLDFDGKTVATVNPSQQSNTQSNNTNKNPYAITLSNVETFSAALQAQRDTADLVIARLKTTNDALKAYRAGFSSPLERLKGQFLNGQF